MTFCVSVADYGVLIPCIPPSYHNGRRFEVGLKCERSVCFWSETVDQSFIRISELIYRMDPQSNDLKHLVESLKEMKLERAATALQLFMEKKVWFCWLGDDSV